MKKNNTKETKVNQKKSGSKMLGIICCLVLVIAAGIVLYSQLSSKNTATTSTEDVSEESATKAAGEKFLEENAKKPGVVSLPSGLQYKVLVEGNGEKHKATDMVTVKYEGRTIDGNVFDSSYKRGDEPVEFALNQVISGWTEVMQLMPVGSKWEVYIPQYMAYGERGMGSDIPPFSALIFTIELIK